MSRSASSRKRYLEFVQDYLHKRLSDDEGADDEQVALDTARADKRRAGALSTWRNRRKNPHLAAYVSWLRPSRRALVVVLLLSLTRSGLELIEPLFMRYIIDHVLLNQTLDAVMRVNRLQLVGLTYLTVVISSSLINALKDYRVRLLNSRFMLTLRRALFDRMVRLPLTRLWEMKTGGILSRLSGDVETTTGLLQLAVISPALSVIRLATAIVILLVVNWRLAVTALAVIPGIMVLSFIFAKRVRPIYRSIRKDAESVDGRVGETFSGIRVVRAFRQETMELLAYMRGRHTILRKELFAQRRELVIWTTWGLLIAVVNVVIVWYGGYLYIRGRATIGDIMAFQWYTFLLLGPVWNIVNSFSDLQRSLAATERVFDILSLEPEKQDVPGAIEAPSAVNEIRFDDVGFAYREGVPVLHDVSATIPGGTVVALVGKSGSGKTTVTDLVARFHDPTSGRILLNGHDLREFRLSSYRRLLAVVQQETFLFDGTVLENIAYARHDVTRENIEDAARRANADEFIRRLPEGYETIIGERGVKLSGGQRQRIAIARAIIASPRILILDEATSSVDTESEQLIQEALRELLVGRTTFVVAHRLSTVRRANLILHLQDGRIVERGTHAELMAAEGAYYRMVLRQMREAEDVGQAALP